MDVIKDGFVYAVSIIVVVVIVIGIVRLFQMLIERSPSIQNFCTWVMDHLHSLVAMVLKKQ